MYVCVYSRCAYARHSLLLNFGPSSSGPRLGVGVELNQDEVYTYLVTAPALTYIHTASTPHLHTLRPSDSPRCTALQSHVGIDSGPETRAAPTLARHAIALSAALPSRQQPHCTTIALSIHTRLRIPPIQ